MKLNKYKVVAVLTAVLLVLTPIINKVVNTMFRSGEFNQSGFGSECLLWLFPIMVLGLFDTINNRDTN